MKRISINLVLDERRARRDGTFPVKLRVIFNRKAKNYSVNEYLSKSEWKDVQRVKTKNELKRIKLVLNGILTRAYTIADQMSVFTFDLFEKEFNDINYNPKSLFDTLQKYIVELKHEGRNSTADSYSNSLNSFRRFVATNGKQLLYFQDITRDWLYEYEKWMITNGKSLSTVGIYLRTMRIAFNIAIENGDCPQSIYPFGRRKYSIPATRNIKRSLDNTDIKKIFQYLPQNAQEEWAKDVWMFSYLCNGISITDIARLKNVNVFENSIQFVRKKTERSTRNDRRTIMVPLLPETKAILTKYQTDSKNNGQYVFKILSPLLSTEEQIKRIKQATKNINKYLTRIGERLKISLNLTTYTARHSFATMLKRNGTSAEFICESLGHNDLKTTENYLGSFEDSYKMEVQSKLLNF